VDNHVDGIYLYMKLLAKDPVRAEQVLKLLTWNGGGMYSSGVGIADIDFLGNVHADQFWMHHSFGTFGSDPSARSDGHLRSAHGRPEERRAKIKGRCAPGICKWFRRLRRRHAGAR